MRDVIYSALEHGFTSPIRDALWGHIYMTPDMEDLTKSAPFMRLHRIFQLGPTYCVYPGATHTRAAHSVGVYHLARRILKNFAERGADEWITPEGIRSFLIAALFHDLGHFPYTHSLKELPLKDHEALTGDIILTEPLKSLIADTGADPYLSAAIIDEDIKTDGGKELLFYRKLLSGVLDPDKLDYLNRDARYCGVPYGAQDVDFILSRIYPHPERGIDIDSRAIPSVESVLFSKYLMYRSVYWHSLVRSATAMIKKALLGGLEKGSITDEELYNLDDQSLFTLMASRKEELFSLGADVQNGRLYITAAEFPYNDEIHKNLSNIKNRLRYEENLAHEFSSVLDCKILPSEVIIDIPEPVNFETGLYITDEQCYFGESSGVFKSETVGSFVKALHTVRIFLAPVHRKRIFNEYDTAKSHSLLYNILDRKEIWI